MSAAAATAEAPPKGKKKLIIIIAVAVLVLLIGGGAAVFMMKQKAAAAEAAAEAEGEDGGHATAKPKAAAHAPPARDSHTPPVFVPLDPFVVNLADRDTDRFAQIGVTLEVDDAKFAEQMKLYMPAIRSAILLVLSNKSSQQLLDRAGKDALAQEIMREAVRPMGIEIEADDEEAVDADSPKPKKKKKKKASVYNPVRSVNFSNFIIQ